MARTDWVGETLNGRYRLDEKLGQGGMAAVYKATDPNLRRVVAVKLIHPHLSDTAEFVRRFEEEAAAVAQLRHSNIVQVYDFNHDDEVYYIVFEFVPGESLDARQKRYKAGGNEMPLAQTTAIVAKVADALDYAHKRNLVHRDVKPANVMINIHEEPILMDFGIVKIAGGTQHTATGAVLGTARYMAPEQIRGERVDARTDIYSLGAMLYELVSGRPPFDAESAMTVMMMHVSDPVPDVRRIRPNLPPGLVAVISKALAKNPADRYQTAGDMARALRAVDLNAAPLPLPSAEQTLVQSPPTPDRTYIDRPAPTAPPIRAAAPATAPPTAPPPAAAATTRSRLPVIIGIAALAVLLLVGGVTIGPRLFGSDGAGNGGGTAVETDGGSAETGAETSGAVLTATDTPAPTAAVAADPTAEPTAVVVAEAPTATTEPTATSEPTSTPEPSATPTEAPTATPTEDPDRDGDGVLNNYDRCPDEAGVPERDGCLLPEKYVQINGISISGDRYVVEYETLGYTEQVPGQHIHFYYNNIAQDQAGVPGGGPWVLYGGPRPFTGYTVSGRPANATAICALVANPDHSIIQDTGNCVALP